MALSANGEQLRELKPITARIRSISLEPRLSQAYRGQSIMPIRMSFRIQCPPRSFEIQRHFQKASSGLEKSGPKIELEHTIIEHKEKHKDKI